MSRHDVASDLLGKVVHSVNGVRGALLASVDGRCVASIVHEHDADAAAAIVASSSALGERLAELTGTGEMLEVVVRSRSGYVVLYRAGDRGVLTLFTNPSVNLALLHLRAREVVDQLGEAVVRAL